ncbi:MAG: sulfotransferase family protein [Gammaproteobacteria bacterium]|nr:sulfotransferase family protein [Gammaproteobacteria bacterium]
MLISYSNRFIFFHVAKVAGLSIRNALQEYCEEPEHFKIARPVRVRRDGSPNPMYEAWAGTLLHAKARDAQKELPAAVFKGFYKFAFVRNPWDWQVSMYHFILKRTDHRHHERVSGMSGFEEYLQWVIKTRNPFTRGAAKTQKEMVTDRDGNLIVDFIGRFESLAEDFHKACKAIGVQASLPQLNRTQHKNYYDYYDKYTKKLVAEHFKDDIELFGYRFAETNV